MAATFMEFWRLRDEVETEGGSLRPWLLGIATDIARNHCRSNRRYRAAAAAATRAGPAGVEVPDHADRWPVRWIQVNASHQGLIKLGAITCTDAVMTRAIVDGIKKTPSQAG
jgi:DNA-directed RNA polymerase specialized sigma24 family protein